MASSTVQYHTGLDYGVGVDTPSGEARNVAVTGVPSTIPLAAGDTVVFSMSEISTQEDLNTSLGISASASGGVGLFSASARMDYAKSCSIHTSSVFLMVNVKVIQAFSMIKQPGIDPVAAALLANGDMTRFQEEFGDMFVRGLTTGGQFFGMIEVVTRDQTDKESLSVSLSASYAAFSASGSFNTSFSDAVSSHQTKVTCYIEGGLTSPVPTQVDTMTQRASTFPGTVAGNAVPYSALLDSYSILPLPAPPNYIDLQHQRDVLTECARIRNEDWMSLNDIDYIMHHPSEFLNVAQFPLDQLRHDLTDDLNAVATAASDALNHPKAAQVPQLKTQTITLPERNKALPPVKQPVSVTIPDWGDEETVDRGGTTTAGVVYPSADDLGLVVQYVYVTDGTGNMGDIVSMVPPAGTEVMSGTTVVVTIQRNPGPHDM